MPKLILERINIDIIDNTIARVCVTEEVRKYRDIEVLTDIAKNVSYGVWRDIISRLFPCFRPSNIKQIFAFSFCFLYKFLEFGSEFEWYIHYSFLSSFSISYYKPIRENIATKEVHEFGSP